MRYSNSLGDILRGQSDLKRLLLLFTVAGSAFAADSFKLVATAGRTVVTAGDDIEIHAFLRNVSQSPLPMMYSGDPRSEFRVEVTAYNGASATTSLHARKRRADPIAGPSANIGMDLAPGKEISVDFTVGEFFDMSAPGTYTLQVFWPRRATVEAIVSEPLLLIVEPNLEESAHPTAAKLVAAKLRHPKPSSTDATLSIEGESLAIPLGKPLRIYYELKNLSQQALTFPVNKLSEYSADVRNEFDGSPVPLNTQSLRVGPNSHVSPPSTLFPPIKIPTGRRITSAVNLDRLVNFTSPGTYSVQLLCKLPPEAGGAEIRSNVILVKIAP